MTQADQRFVVVGGGLAGARAIETLRDEGFEGSLVLLCAEAHLPYERPPLSKAVLAGRDDVAVATLHDQSWYAERHVELRMTAMATRLDTAAQAVFLAICGRSMIRWLCSRGSGRNRAWSSWELAG